MSEGSKAVKLSELPGEDRIFLVSDDQEYVAVPGVGLWRATGLDELWPVPLESMSRSVRTCSRERWLEEVKLDFSTSPGQ